MNSVHKIVPPTSFKRLDNYLEKLKQLYLDMIQVMEDEQLIVPADEVRPLPPQEIVYKLFALPACKKFYLDPLIYTVCTAYKNYLNGAYGIEKFNAFLEIPITSYYKNIRDDEGKEFVSRYGRIYLKNKIKKLNSSSRMILIKDDEEGWHLWICNSKKH